MSQAIKKLENISLATIGGTHEDAGVVNQIMEWAKANCHLIAPATAVGAMPEGLGVAFSSVQVDLTTTGSGDYVKYVSGDVYPVGDKLGLSRHILERIAAAVGVSWDPEASMRIDNGADPYYCHWKAVGFYRSFDGTVATLARNKEMDLRDGSAQLVALYDRFKASTAKFQAGKGGKYAPKDPTGQIREMRLHILAHAETKAQLRAIRSLGVKSAYTYAELQKPFVAARIMWTGRTRDPELRRVFAEKTADAFLGGVSSLFGRGTARPVEVRTSSPAPLKLTGAPPVGSVPVDDDDGIDLGEIGGDEEDQQQQARPANEQRRQAQARAAAVGPTLPSGDSKGKPLSEASDKDLKYWSNRYERELAEDTSRNRERDQEMLDAVNSELARRAEAQQAGGGKY